VTGIRTGFCKKQRIEVGEAGDRGAPDRVGLEMKFGAGLALTDPMSGEVVVNLPGASKPRRKNPRAKSPHEAQIDSFNRRFAPSVVRTGFRMRDLTLTVSSVFARRRQLLCSVAGRRHRQGNTFSWVFLLRGQATTLLRYAGTDCVADAFPAATQLERPLLRDQLEAVIQGSLEPFSLWRLSVPHRRIPLLQYLGIRLIAIDDHPRSMPHH
jgi:hypothetical protein